MYCSPMNILLLLATAAAGTNGTQPWKLRNAKRNATNAMPWKLRNAKRGNMSHWTGLHVALLYRGMHYGSYKSERHGGKFVRVNANHASVIENHLAKIRRPLEKAGATISTVLACTHASDVVQDWLKNVEASHSEVIETQLRKDKKNKVRPNELLQRAYALASEHEWDVLISLRADLFLKRDLADLTRPPVTERLWLPFREVFLNIHHTPCAFHERAPNERCLYAWTKHGSRFSDALRIIPRRMLPDIQAAVDELVRHQVWDQHGLAFQLKKLRGFDIPRNVTPLVEGFWDSNIDTRANPLFTLARGSRFLSKLPKSERPPEEGPR